MFGRLPSLKPEEVEKFVGIAGYVSRSKGIGGVIKSRPEDFLAWEVLVDGLDAKILYESGRRYAEGLGDYTLAVMKKRGIDTIRALTAVARSIGLKPGKISVCGIKDKMSVSWQFIAVPRGFIDKSGLRLGELLHIFPIEDRRAPLTSRSLAKNFFEIKIRNSSGDLSDVEDCVGELRSKGVPNFYGHQRFGITRPITPVVGWLMMLNRLEDAVKSFIGEYSILESRQNQEARERFSRELNLKSALEYFPKSLRYEREMIRYLINHPGDYAGALRALPLRLRRLLVESVSALIFNKALSRIISAGRLRDMELGDFVLRLDSFGRPRPGKPIIITRGNIEQAERLFGLGKLAIALPVPGYLSAIPKSSKGEAILDAMDELEISLKMFRLKGVPEASTRGSLRPITIPKWTCEIVQPDDGSITLKVSLPPGCYATIFLREVMKPKSPLAFIGKMDNNDHVHEVS